MSETEMSEQHVYASRVLVLEARAISYAKAVTAFAPFLEASPELLHQAVLRLAASRLRLTGDDGAVAWAERLERMAREDPYLAPKEG